MGIVMIARSILHCIHVKKFHAGSIYIISLVSIAWPPQNGIFY